MADFQPPPTFTSPILVNPKAEKEEDRVTFNPVWLKWFLDLINIINGLGAGTGIPITALEVSGAAEDQFIKVNAAMTAFEFASPGYSPYMLAARSFGRASPKIADIRVGRGITLTLDAQGYTLIAAPDDAQVVLAGQIFGG